MDNLIWKCPCCELTLNVPEDWSYQNLAARGAPVCQTCDEEMKLEGDGAGNKTLHVGDVTVTVGKTATIESPWKREVCPHCSQQDCFFDCEKSVAEAFDPRIESLNRKGGGDEIIARLKTNGALDGIEALILACAARGVDVETGEFVAAVDDAKDAVGNNT